MIKKVADELKKYASYNVLARKALIFGVPIITLIIIIILMLVTGAIGTSFLGFGKGIIIPAILLVILFVIRIKCMDDTRAMESTFWDIKSAITRLKCRSQITSYTSTDESIQKKRELINEFYKSHNIK